MLRLLDVFVGRPRGVAHVVAAAFYLLNPYTVIFTARTSIVLLGYAALPWLLLVVYHGVRGGARLARLAGLVVGRRVRADPHLDRRRHQRARWSAGCWSGRCVLLIYEPLIGSVRWRDSARFLVRMGVLGTLASLWWIVPLVRARPLRHRLPPVHRAAAHDLGHQQRRPRRCG